MLQAIASKLMEKQLEGPHKLVASWPRKINRPGVTGLELTLEIVPDVPAEREE